jgi:hypothetical protein
VSVDDVSFGNTRFAHQYFMAIQPHGTALSRALMAHVVTFFGISSKYGAAGHALLWYLEFAMIPKLKTYGSEHSSTFATSIGTQPANANVQGPASPATPHAAYPSLLVTAAQCSI